MYGKIFDSMYDGTLVEDWRALVTFQQMIVLCDADGVIDMTPHAISRRTGIPIEHIEAGIRVLENPDPYSRTHAEEGRRIMRLDEHRPWGWLIVNHSKYKLLQDADAVRAQTRERVRKHRQKQKEQQERNVTPSQDVTEESLQSVTVTDGNGQKRHTDTDTDTDTDISQDLISSQETPTAAKKFAALCEIEFNENIWPWYPKRQNNPKAKALRAYTARRRAGAECEAIRAGVLRYARYCEQRGIINTEFIKQAATFFGPEKFYEEPWNAAEKTQRLSAVDRVRTANNL